MKITTFATGIIKFFDTAILFKLSINDNIIPWLLVHSLPDYLEFLLNNNKNLLNSIGILDGSEINLDRLEQAGNEFFIRHPDVKIWHMIFHQDDFIKLMEHLRNLSDGSNTIVKC